MQNYFCLGPSPAEEDCAQVSQPGYRERALKECARYIQLLRDTFGQEPEGARLSFKWFEHDFGAYCEVVCYFDTDVEASIEYAQRCEYGAPATWEG
jgi:hypothetical protein